MIPFEIFSKTELRVGTIKTAEKVEGSSKLLKLQIDIGEETRQIIAGIGKAYSPDDLIEKQVVIVANLEPRELMGHESQGMLLAASNGDPVLIVPESPVSPGSNIQ